MESDKFGRITPNISEKRKLKNTTVRYSLLITLYAIVIFFLGTVLHKKLFPKDQTGAFLLKHEGDYMTRTWGPGIYERFETKKLLDESPNYLSFRFKPNSVAHHHLLDQKNDKIIFDVTYKTDSYRRRITPVKSIFPRNNFIAIFGCSFTMGVGVREDETLPYFMGKMLDEYTPYNYGGPRGPHEILWNLHHRNFRQEIKEKQGIGVYHYINDHIARSVGGPTWMSCCAKNMPYFYMKNGRLAGGEESFAKAMPVKTNLYTQFTKNSVARMINTNQPMAIKDEHVNLVCTIIEETKKNFLQQFPGSSFVTLFSLNTHFDSDFKLMECLRKRKISFYHPPKSDIYEGLNRPYANHPTAKYYQIMAKDFSSWIKDGHLQRQNQLKENKITFNQSN